MLLPMFPCRYPYKPPHCSCFASFHQHLEWSLCHSVSCTQSTCGLLRDQDSVPPAMARLDDLRTLLSLSVTVLLCKWQPPMLLSGLQGERAQGSLYNAWQRKCTKNIFNWRYQLNSINVYRVPYHFMCWTFADEYEGHARICSEDPKISKSNTGPVGKELRI